MVSAKDALREQIAQASRNKQLLDEQQAIHEQLNAQLTDMTAGNEKLQQDIETAPPIEEPEISKAADSEPPSTISPLHEEKLKDIADILKRLS